jgi:hypothetical protein
MKTFLIYILLSPIGCIFLNDTPSDFELKLNNIASDFRKKIMEEDECKNLMYDASRVADDIDNELKKEDYSASEISQYKDIKKKAEALEAYIGAIGGCANTFPTIEEFNSANRIVGGSISNVIQGKFCMDFISVNLGNYIVYLCQNNTSTNLSVKYKWKAPDGMNSGSGDMNLSSKSIRHIYDNREKPNQKKISIFGVTCKPF